MMTQEARSVANQHRTLQLELDNDDRVIETLLDFLVRWSNLDDQHQAFRLRLALEEAISNAMNHGNLELPSSLRESLDESEYFRMAQRRRKEMPYRDRRVYLQAVHSDREIRVTIRDEGPGFEYEQVLANTFSNDLASPTGRGLKLIRELMDECDFAGAGSQLTLAMKLS